MQTLPNKETLQQKHFSTARRAAVHNFGQKMQLFMNSLTSMSRSKFLQNIPQACAKHHSLFVHDFLTKLRFNQVNLASICLFLHLMIKLYFSINLIRKYECFFSHKFDMKTQKCLVVGYFFKCYFQIFSIILIFFLQNKANKCIFYIYSTFWKNKIKYSKFFMSSKYFDLY